MDEDTARIIKDANDKAMKPLHVPELPRISSIQVRKKELILPFRLSEYLLKKIDNYVKRHNMGNRSQAVRTLVSKGLEGEPDGD